MSDRFSRAHEYICEAWPDTPASMVNFALAWVAHLQRLATAGHSPTPQYADWGLSEAEAEQMMDAVETLLLDLQTPGFDQDDPATL